jgi:hypothetical protein
MKNDLFEGMMKNNLNVVAPNGSVIASFHGAKSTKGCQINIVRSNVHPSLIVSLAAIILFPF